MKRFELAEHIFWDLSRLNVDPLTLVEIHGGPPLVDRNMPSSQVALWDGEEIIVALGCTRDEYEEALPHELVHRLADSPRWEHLNSEIDNAMHHDREVFIEEIATQVGRRMAKRYARYRAKAAVLETR